LLPSDLGMSQLDYFFGTIALSGCSLKSGDWIWIKSAEIDVWWHPSGRAKSAR
jgi:hypothetical protein